MKRQEANLFPLKYQDDDENDSFFKNHDHDVQRTLADPGSALQRVPCRESGRSVTQLRVGSRLAMPRPTPHRPGPCKNPNSEATQRTPKAPRTTSARTDKCGCFKQNRRIPNLEIRECLFFQEI